VATILLTRNRSVKPAGVACVTVEPSAWDAFAILLGVNPDELPGTQVLADQNGWLRARWRPGEPDDWNAPERLDAVIRTIAMHPLTGGAVTHAHHH
jgi:hypothetical protein